jgi:predicted nucleotidyltransferase
MSIRIEMDRKRLEDVCRQNHIRSLALFGSVLRDDFRPDSDVDVLVEFEPGYVLGFRVFRLEEQLSALFGGHRVDVVNRKFLNHRLRDRVLASAETQYVEG